MFAQPFKGPEESSIPRGGEVIGAGKDVSLSIERQIALIDAQLIYTESMRLFCYGIIRYEDVFKIPHYTKFCWEYQHTPSKGFFVSPKELNDYT